MKITKKILENIIKEEIASILQEQNPILAKEKMIADKKAECKNLEGKAKAKCEEELEKLEADLAGPSGKEPKRPTKKNAKPAKPNTNSGAEKEKYIDNLSKDLGIKTKR
jgi:hypothetical protein